MASQTFLSIFGFNRSTKSNAQPNASATPPSSLLSAASGTDFAGRRASVGKLGGGHNQEDPEESHTSAIPTSRLIRVSSDLEANRPELVSLESDDDGRHSSRVDARYDKTNSNSNNSNYSNSSSSNNHSHNKNKENNQSNNSDSSNIGSKNSSKGCYSSRKESDRNNRSNRSSLGSNNRGARASETSDESESSTSGSDLSDNDEEDEKVANYIKQIEATLKGGSKLQLLLKREFEESCAVRQLVGLNSSDMFTEVVERLLSLQELSLDDITKMRGLIRKIQKQNVEIYNILQRNLDTDGVTNEFNICLEDFDEVKLNAALFGIDDMEDDNSSSKIGKSRGDSFSGTSRNGSSSGGGGYSSGGSQNRRRRDVIDPEEEPDLRYDP